MNYPFNIRWLYTLITSAKPWNDRINCIPLGTFSLRAPLRLRRVLAGSLYWWSVMSSSSLLLACFKKIKYESWSFRVTRLHIQYKLYTMLCNIGLVNVLILKIGMRVLFIEMSEWIVPNTYIIWKSWQSYWDIKSQNLSIYCLWPLQSTFIKRNTL